MSMPRSQSHSAAMRQKASKRWLRSLAFLRGEPYGARASLGFTAKFVRAAGVLVRGGTKRNSHAREHRLRTNEVPTGLSLLSHNTQQAVINSFKLVVFPHPKISMLKKSKTETTRQAVLRCPLFVYLLGNTKLSVIE